MDLNTFKDEQKKVRKEVTGKMVASLLAAFGFVLALAWNDAIKSAIESFFPVGSAGLATKFIYAVLLTLAVAIAGYYISKATSKEEGK
jgi:Tfp pilus assembly protein PilO